MKSLLHPVASYCPVAAYAVLLVVFCCTTVASRSVDGNDKLTIGSAAPPLDVKHWVQTGEGKFSKVTEFVPGRIYVIEFWATWCGPCMASMPHLADMQTKYTAKGVQIISISDESLETVEEFLTRNVPPRLAGESKAPINFRDVTKSYCLTTDPDGSSQEQFMNAAGQNTLPCAFIVGKDGKIEWIGNPMEMESPLEMVVSDQWDREEFAAQFNEAREQETLMKDAEKEIGVLVKKRNFPEALAKTDEFLDRAKQSEAKFKLLNIKLRIQQAAKSKTNEVKATFAMMFKLGEDDSFLAYQIASQVWEMNEKGLIDSKDILRGARDMVKKAAEPEEGNAKALLLDSLAHIEYALGNNEVALKTQEEAMSVADDEGKAELKEFLDELKSEVGKQKK